MSQKSEDTQESISEADHQDTDQGLAVLWTALPIVAIVFATATLYRGRDVLLPITMALILAVIFTPLASCLERYVGRVLSAALAVLLAVTAIGAIGYFLAIELTAVADEVAGYSDNIGDKLAKLETTSPPWGACRRRPRSLRTEFPREK